MKKKKINRPRTKPQTRIKQQNANKGANAPNFTAGTIVQCYDKTSGLFVGKHRNDEMPENSETAVQKSRRLRRIKELGKNWRAEAVKDEARDIIGKPIKSDEEKLLNKGVVQAFELTGKQAIYDVPRLSDRPIPVRKEPGFWGWLKGLWS